MTRRIPLLPTLLVAAAVAMMIGLGVWQLQRAEWKAGLISSYEQAQSMSSTVPWPRDEAAVQASLFRWSEFACDRVLGARAGAGTRADGAKGWQHIARCALDTDDEAEVALGWSPHPQAPQWEGGETRGVIAPSGVLVAAPPLAGLEPLALPDPADLPNNHLGYAGQWFFFALTAASIYVLALRRRR